ncbi:MAG: phage tail protein [Actinomycetota bacterium]
MALPEGDAVAGYAWQVEIDSVQIAQFKELTGVSSEIQVIEHRENKPGGIHVMKKLPGRSASGDITLRKGKTSDKSLWEWHKKVQDGDLEGARKNGSVVLYDYARGEVARYNFVAGWPSRVSLGPLQAAGNDVLLEECTIVHEGLSLA